MASEGQGTLGGALLGLVSAAIALGTAFGFDLNTEQQAAITAFGGAVLAVAPLIGALLDHSRRQSKAREQAATISAEALTAAAEIRVRGVKKARG